MSDSTSLPEICQASLLVHLQPHLFKALCDPVRISILSKLASQPTPQTVSQLAACFGIDFSGVSRHLKILRDANIVTAEKHGRQILYALKTDELVGTLRAIADALEGCIQAPVD